MKMKTLVLTLSSALLAFNVSASSSGGTTTPKTKMIVGDSIFAYTGDIHKYLESDLKEKIDTHAKVGCQMNGGNLICSSYYTMPKQYSRASKTGIKTVIMNGGGNDFLLGDGKNCTTDACNNNVLAAVEETAAGLFSTMKSNGTQQIIFMGYYLTGDRDHVNNRSMDYKIANYPALGVDFVDTRAAFKGKESSYIGSDKIHPTAAGSRALADLIKAKLK